MTDPQVARGWVGVTSLPLTTPRPLLTPHLTLGRSAQINDARNLEQDTRGTACYGRKIARDYGRSATTAVAHLPEITREIARDIHEQDGARQQVVVAVPPPVPPPSPPPLPPPLPLPAVESIASRIALRRQDSARRRATGSSRNSRNQMVVAAALSPPRSSRAHSDTGRLTSGSPRHKSCNSPGRSSAPAKLKPKPAKPKPQGGIVPYGSGVKSIRGSC